ncbi:hypothetical protein EYZ11_013403 [Aspergillus tanneri]|uniref:Uncharacterized protein n=1 Tax=Aspergillus tanneri TaxID=1220188 RepID=A0A4S3J364_9EURO|nr:hypothetical protein EYZ11_013403 [Aspergillus tanneri]
MQLGSPFKSPLKTKSKPNSYPPDIRGYCLYSYIPGELESTICRYYAFAGRTSRIERGKVPNPSASKNVSGAEWLAPLLKCQLLETKGSKYLSLHISRRDVSMCSLGSEEKQFPKSKTSIERQEKASTSSDNPRQERELVVKNASAKAGSAS